MTLIPFEGGKPIFKDGKVGTGAACCCNKCSGPCESNGDCAPGCVCVYGECKICTCACFEVGVKGRYDFNMDPYSDPNNEFWSTGTANNCGFAQAAYGKLDYPVTIGGYDVILNAGGVTVMQSITTGCAGVDCVWPDATLTYDEDGCPNGIDLGEPVCTCVVTRDSFNCDPMFGDWGGTDEEMCQKARDFLDANSPEINLRACPENPLP